MRFLVTRPEPDASEQADELRSQGYEVVVSPMLDVDLLDPGLGDGNIDPAGLIVTSKNALRALQRYPAAPGLFSKPMYCVGPGTAEKARTLGFQNVVAGTGNSGDLAQLIRKTAKPEDGLLLRLTGKTPSDAPQRLSDDLVNAGYFVTDIVCYDITPATSLTEEARSFLDEDRLTCVILMSPLTAKTFLSCLDADGLTVQSGNLRYICLSQAVAETLCGFPQAHIFVADKPNRSGLGSILDRAVAELS